MDNSGTRQDVQAAIATIDEYVKTDIGAAVELYDSVRSMMGKEDKKKYFRFIYEALSDENSEKMIAAAHKGVDSAIVMLGKGFYFEKLHKNGAKSMEEAAYWSELAISKRREPAAMYHLAVLLRKGEGVEKNLNRSFTLCYEAIEKNRDWTDLAVCEMSALYIEALNDSGKAAQLYRMAANDVRCLSAAYELGRLYFEGRGVDRNLSEAKCLMELVVSGAGDKYTKLKRNASEILKKIPDSLAAAQWKPSGETGELPHFVKDDYEKAKVGVLFTEDKDVQTSNTCGEIEIVTEGVSSSADTEIVVGSECSSGRDSNRNTVSEDDLVVVVEDDSAGSAGRVARKTEDAKTGTAKKLEQQVAKETKGKQLSDVSPKKRIVFLLLGMTLGWLGIHFLYAKRYVMWIVTLVTFIALIVSAVAKMMGLLALAVIALIVLWHLFSMFGKKDGSKLRMKWF